MALYSNNEWSRNIPSHPNGTAINYTIYAKDDLNHWSYEDNSGQTFF